MHYIANFLAWPADTGVTGGDLGYLAVLGGIWRHLMCHEGGCWRPGHLIAGTRVCRRHRS